jgi:hypothetical protein
MVDRYEDIARVPAATWDAVVDPEDLQQSHAFVLACQQSAVRGARYRHLVIRRGGEVAAVASLSSLDARLDLLAPAWIRRLGIAIRSRLAERFLTMPVAFCGLPVSFGRPCVAIGPTPDTNTVVELISLETLDWARSIGAALACVKEFNPVDDAVMSPLATLGWHRTSSLPSCSMTLRWASAADWLSSMRSGYRHQVLAARHRGETHRLDVRTIEDFGAYAEAIHHLYSQTMDRAEFQLERLEAEFITQLNALGVTSRAILVSQREHLVAAAVLLRTPRVVTFLLAGMDYSLARETGAYPLLVSEVVTEALRLGARRLELGQTSYPLKMRLGAELIPRTMYLRALNPLGHTVLGVISKALFPTRTYPMHRVFRSPVAVE